jgi:hypothetical protein
MVFWIPSARAVFGTLFNSSVGKDADGRDANICSLTRGFYNFINRAPKDTRHGENWFFNAFTAAHKYGPNKVINTKVILTRQGANSW